MKIYIFGMGKGKTYLDRCLLPETEICGYIDNYKSEEIGFFDERPVVSQKNLGESYDYIIITLMQFEAGNSAEANLHDSSTESFILGKA